VSDLAIPASWDDVTAGWMAGALGTDVESVELLLVDDGTNRRARFAITTPAGDRSTVFLKASDPAHAELNARTGGVFNEPRLFLGGTPLPLEHPAVHRSLLDEPTLDFLLVMEDVTARGGDPRDSTRPYTVDQATSGALGLAALHGAYWGDRFDADGSLGWVEPFVPWGGMSKGIDIGMRNAGDRIVEPVRAMTGEVIKRTYWDRYIGTLLDGPTTLLHGDAHIGNTYVLPDGTVGFLDWQVVRRGDAVIDLGYFLQGAVPVDDRRSSEEAIVRAYAEALGESSFDELWLRYRASAAHGLAIWLATAAGNWQRPEVSITLAERYAAAFVDLDSAAAIDELAG
jgi:hypothetical protein